jgi:hypothetical protein
MTDIEGTDQSDSFIERLVDAHARGRADEVEALLEQLNDVSDALELLNVTDSASFIGWDDLPTPEQEEDFNLLEQLLDEERLAEIEAGGSLTPDEVMEWTRAAIEVIFTDDVDADVYPTWCIGRLEDKAGRSAVLAWLVYGYSVPGITLEAVGLFDDREQAIAALKALGITEPEDYERHLVSQAK